MVLSFWLCIGLQIWGVVMIIGAYKRWAFLVDDPNLIKRFGREGTISVVYGAGVCLIAMAVFGLMLH